MLARAVPEAERDVHLSASANLATLIRKEKSEVDGKRLDHPDSGVKDTKLELNGSGHSQTLLPGL